MSIDLGMIRTLNFTLSTREDHIVPWKATYKAILLLAGLVNFVLAATAHIAKVINPPQAKKFYWSHIRNARDPWKWLETADRSEGSWWPQLEK